MNVADCGAYCDHGMHLDEVLLGFAEELLCLIIIGSAFAFFRK